MSVAHISELIPFLEKIGARPRKSLSQNFLIDPNIIRKIVLLADIQPGEQVIEIGSRPGALTAALLEAGAFVTAVEKDSLFAQELYRLQTTDRRLEVIEGDCLKIPLSGTCKVVGNLPYSITTPILERICAGSFSSFIFMAQKEFAERLMAKAGTKEYGSLTLFINSHAKINGSFPVSRGCFYPRPKVDSTILRLDFTGSPDPEALFTLIRRAFQQRRKMITTSLKELFPQAQIREALQKAGASIEARPEMLTLVQWRQVFECLSGCPLMT